MSAETSRFFDRRRSFGFSTGFHCMNLIVPRRIQTEAFESPLDRRFTKKMSQNSRQHETTTRREESPNPYAAPRRIESLADCDIYHTIELPDFLEGSSWTTTCRRQLAIFLGALTSNGRRCRLSD